MSVSLEGVHVAPADLHSHADQSENAPVAEQSEVDRAVAFVYRWLATLTMIGCLLGILTGILAQAAGASETVIEVVRFPGELFIRALKAVVTPMIFTSMVGTSAKLGEVGAASKMSALAMRFYLTTTAMAAVEGLLLFNIFSAAFSPMSADEDAVAEGTGDAEKLTVVGTILDFGRDLVPDNIFRAFLELKLLGIITFGFFFGAMLCQTPQGRQVINLIDTCYEALVLMVRKVIVLTPFCVSSLVAGAIAKADNFGAALGNVGALFAVVLLGQLWHVFGFYSALYTFFTRKNPLRFHRGLPQMWITAFGTSSSAATLSTTIKTCLDLGVSAQAANFICPLGCTINMDGSCIDRIITIPWIAMVASQPLSVGGQLLTLVIVCMMSIGASPIPSSGVSTLLVMVEAAGIEITPTVEMLVGFVLAIEWLLDSIRTAVNVSGDAFGAAILDHTMSRSSHGDGMAAHGMTPVLPAAPGSLLAGDTSVKPGDNKATAATKAERQSPARASGTGTRCCLGLLT